MYGRKRKWEAHGASHFKWSGKRDSNSRPQPWQGCALPTELFPLGRFADQRSLFQAISSFSEARSIYRFFNAVQGPAALHGLVLQCLMASTPTCVASLAGF